MPVEGLLVDCPKLGCVRRYRQTATQLVHTHSQTAWGQGFFFFKWLLKLTVLILVIHVMMVYLHLATEKSAQSCNGLYPSITIWSFTHFRLNLDQLQLWFYRYNSSCKYTHILEFMVGTWNPTINLTKYSNVGRIQLCFKGQWSNYFPCLEFSKFH